MVEKINLHNFVKVVYNICLQVETLNVEPSKRLSKVIEIYMNLVANSNIDHNMKKQMNDLVKTSVTDIVNVYFRKYPDPPSPKKCCCFFP